MRRLMWFAVGFAVICAIGAYFPMGMWILVPALPAAVVSVLLGILGRDNRRCRIGSVILAGCCVACVWCFLFERLWIAPLRSYDDTELTSTVEITEYSTPTDYGSVTEGRLLLDGRQRKVRLYTDGEEQLSPGDTLTGTFRVRLTVDGGARESTYYQGEGVFLLAYGEDVKRIPGTGRELRHFPARLRWKLSDILQNTFPADTRGFAKALLLGDDRDIDYETDTALKLSGIRHVIAVSGLHVAILFSFVYKLVAKRRWLTALFGIPVLFLFAAAAGFTPSVLRAVLMQSLMILAMLVNKEYDPPTGLAFAVLVMLFINPFAILSVSLQLSGSCIIGMFLLSERVSKYLLSEKRLGTGKGRSIKARFVRSLAGSVSVSVSTIAVTAPLSALYFGTVSIIGILTNFLTLWAVTLSFYGVIAVCAVGAVFLPLAKLLASAVSWGIRYVTAVAGLLAKLPMAAVYTNSVYILLWLVFIYVLILIFAAGDRARGGLLTLCVLGSLIISVGLSWAEPRLERYRVTVLDVGQGQSVLLQSRGSYYLVDCGGSVDTRAADAAAQALLSQGVSRLDGLILTHYDADHAAGAELLLTRIRTEAVYLPEIDEDNPLRQRIAALYPERTDWITEETTLEGENFRLSLYPGQSSGNDNESCMCVLFQTENCDILITGDRNSSGEQYLLEQADLPELELLVAGHHGAASSTGLPLLAATRPKCVAISVAEDNTYGHPHADVLRRLALFGCEVYRTDERGTIVFRG